MAEFPRSQNLTGNLLGDIATACLRDAQAWTGLHCELLSGIEALWVECTRKQGEAIESSARTVQGLFDGRHLIEITQLQREWLASAARHAADTTGKWAGDSANWSRAAVATTERVRSAANEAAAQMAVERRAAE